MDLVSFNKERLINQVQRAIGILKKDEFAKLTAELRDLLLNNWNAAIKELIADALRLLNTSGDFSEADLQEILAQVQAKVGTAFVNQIAQPLYQIQEQTYLAGLTGISATATFQLIDTAAVEMLNRHQIYWVKQFTDAKIFPRIAELGQQIISQGLARQKAGELLQSGLQGEVGDYGIYYFKGLSNHIVTRSRELGRVEGYVRAGVEFLKISAVIDERTTPICAEMNGRIIAVSKAVEMRDALIEAESPEDVKQITPWLEPDDIADLSNAELPVGMSLPPYHFNCRTRTVKASKADISANT